MANMRFALLFVVSFSLFAVHAEGAQAGSDHHFGLIVNPYNQDWESPDKTARLLKELGVKLVISKLSWKDIEPEKGKFCHKGWERFDGLVNRLTDLGIRIMPFISATSRWAIDPQLSPANWKGKKFGPPAGNPEDVAAFFIQVVKRYKDRIKFWALYNNPQNKNHWTEPGVLAEMYRLGRQVLDKHQPEGRLVMSGFESAKKQGAPYLERFLRAGGGNYVDMYDFHMELGGDTFSGTEANTFLYKKILARYGQASKPVQYGAFGQKSEFRPPKWLVGRWKRKGRNPLDYATMTPERQANRLVKTVVLGRSLGVGRIFWGRTRDYAPASGPSYDRWVEKRKNKKLGWVLTTAYGRTSGIVDYDYSPKPAFHAFKVLIDKLDKADVFKNLDLGKDAKGVVFEEGTKLTAVLFSWKGEIPLTFNSSSRELKVYDIFGKQKASVPVKNGKFTIKISPDPIYVEGELRDIRLSKPKEVMQHS